MRCFREEIFGPVTPVRAALAPPPLLCAPSCLLCPLAQPPPPRYNAPCPHHPIPSPPHALTTPLPPPPPSPPPSTLSRQVYRFSSDAEALQLANDTEYGLAAYFFTQVGVVGGGVSGWGGGGSGWAGRGVGAATHGLLARRLPAGTHTLLSLPPPPPPGPVARLDCRRGAALRDGGGE